MDYYKLKVLNHKRKIITILIIILLIGGLLYYFYFYQDDSLEEVLLKNDVEEENNISYSTDIIYVDIKGYVSVPGVYSFNILENARINDLIIKAGGLKKEADTSTINLSKKLEDEMTIIIYSKSEINDYLKNQDKLKNALELCEIKLKNDACLNKNNELTNNVVNINSASKEELMTLSGIGEAKAIAIIQYREKNSFKNIEELKNVEGIGESLFETIKNNITI